jgi:hypothetical protein
VVRQCLRIGSVRPTGLSRAMCRGARSAIPALQTWMNVETYGNRRLALERTGARPAVRDAIARSRTRTVIRQGDSRSNHRPFDSHAGASSGTAAGVIQIRAFAGRQPDWQPVGPSDSRLGAAHSLHGGLRRYLAAHRGTCWRAVLHEDRAPIHLRGSRQLPPCHEGPARDQPLAIANQLPQCNGSDADHPAIRHRGPAGVCVHVGDPHGPPYSIERLVTDDGRTTGVS